MNAQPAHATGAREHGLDPGNQIIGERLVGPDQGIGNELFLQQKIAALDGEASHREFRTVLKRPGDSHGVHAADEAPHHQQIVGIVQIRRPSCTALKHCKGEALIVIQRVPAIEQQWRHDGDLQIGQLLREGVLLQYLLPRPALWAIELGNHRRAFFHANLIHAVLITIECQNAGIGADADTLHGFQHGFRRQELVGVNIGCLGNIAWVLLTVVAGGHIAGIVLIEFGPSIL